MFEINDLGLKLDLDSNWKRLNIDVDVPYFYEGFTNQYISLYILRYGLSIGNCNDEYIAQKFSEYQDENVILSEICEKEINNKPFKYLAILIKDLDKNCYVYKIFTTFYGKVNYLGGIDTYFNDLDDLDYVKTIFEKVIMIGEL